MSGCKQTHIVGACQILFSVLAFSVFFFQKEENVMVIAACMLLPTTSTRSLLSFFWPLKFFRVFFFRGPGNTLLIVPIVQYILPSQACFE